MGDIPTSKIELSLNCIEFPDIDSIVTVNISGRKQVCDKIYDVIAKNFAIIDIQG